MTLPPTASVVPEGIELGVREGLRARFRTPGSVTRAQGIFSIGNLHNEYCEAQTFSSGSAKKMKAEDFVIKAKRAPKDPNAPKNPKS